MQVPLGIGRKLNYNADLLKVTMNAEIKIEGKMRWHKIERNF